MTAKEALEIVKNYVARFEHNPPRDDSDMDWQRGADYVRTQVHALITEHIEPCLTVEVEREVHVPEWVNA